MSRLCVSISHVKIDHCVKSSSLVISFGLGLDFGSILGQADQFILPILLFLSSASIITSTHYSMFSYLIYIVDTHTRYNLFFLYSILKGDGSRGRRRGWRRKSRGKISWSVEEEEYGEERNGGEGKWERRKKGREGKGTKDNVNPMHVQSSNPPSIGAVPARVDWLVWKASIPGLL